MKKSFPPFESRRARGLRLGFCVALPLLAATGGMSRARAGGAPAEANEAPYLNPDLDFEVRARDLVARMTVEENVSQLTNQAAAIPRLRWNYLLP